jgi:chromatin remodeling complex protein RSC6
MPPKNQSISARKDISKALLKILLENDLNTLTAKEARELLSKELNEEFTTPEDQKEIRKSIRKTIVSNAKKFSQYTGTPKKQINRKKLQLSEAMATVCGTDKADRCEVVRLIWEYIKSNNLQNPENGREINCDENLKRVFNNQETVTAFSLNRYISAHLSPLDDEPTESKTSTVNSEPSSPKPDKMDIDSSNDQEDLPKKPAPKKTPQKPAPKKDPPSKVVVKKETPKKDPPKKETPKKDPPIKDSPKKVVVKKESTPKQTSSASGNRSPVTSPRPESSSNVPQSATVVMDTEEDDEEEDFQQSRQ